MEVFRPVQNKEAVAAVKKNAGIKMVVPKDYYLAKDTENFIWLRKEAGKYSQGIFIISSDYLDTAQFSKRVLCLVLILHYKKCSRIGFRILYDYRYCLYSTR